MLRSPLERLKSLPHLFKFDAAVRVLTLASPRGVSDDDAIAFKSPPVLGQPVAEVLDAAAPIDGQPGLLVSPLIGLVGPSGEMPRWYTELLAQAWRQKSRAIVSFFDLLGQRLIAGFARAGGKYRLTRSSETAHRAGGDEPIGAALLAFTGFGTPHLTDRLAAGPDALRHYAGFFAGHPRSAVRLASMAADYLGLPVEVEEFAGAWLTIAPDQQSRLPRGRLPGAYHQLGQSAAVGTRAFDQQARFILRIGPLSRAAFEALLPDRYRLGELVSLVRAYVGWEADFAVNLVLEAGEIPALTLAGGPAPAPRLGWTSWLPAPTAELIGRKTVTDTLFAATLVESLAGRPAPLA